MILLVAAILIALLFAVPRPQQGINDGEASLISVLLIAVISTVITLALFGPI